MKRRHSQRGANVLEFALTVPIVMTMVFAVMDFGRAFDVYQIITNAAREGARYSVAPSPGTSSLPSASAVEARVRDYLASGKVSGANVTINQAFVATVNNVATSCTDVQVTVPYKALFFPFTVNLQTRAVMRNETN